MSSKKKLEKKNYNKNIAKMDRSKCNEMDRLYTEIKNIKLQLSSVEEKGYKKLDGEITEGANSQLSYKRSGKLINHIHELVKNDLIEYGIDESLIHPKLDSTSKELQLTGYFKKKKQDVCVIPRDIEKKEEIIYVGPLSNQKKVIKNTIDEYGEELTRKILTINIRSQLNGIKKNKDTLFERTIAESINLHKKHKKMVLGEVYMVATYEYEKKNGERKKICPNLEEYISFFTEINGRKDENDEEYKYERVALIVVDIYNEEPKIYNSTYQLKKDGLVSKEFDVELKDISFENFSKDIINIYSDRFRVSRILIDNLIN